MPLRGWRKLAGASWGPPADPQFFGELEVDAGPLLAFVEGRRAATGAHVTVTHVVGKALAYALTQVPELNTRMAWGRAWPRPSVDVFFIVATRAGSDLTGVKVVGADTKPVAEVAAELDRRARAALAGDDPDLGRGKALMDRLPQVLLRPALRVSGWLTSNLSLDLPALGMRRDTFGSAMVTSVGMWGVGRAFAPLAPYYKVPVLVLVGEVAPRPAVVGGEVVARPTLTVTATFDHRHADGSHAARLAGAVRRYLADPAAFEPGP